MDARSQNTAVENVGRAFGRLWLGVTSVFKSNVPMSRINGRHTTNAIFSGDNTIGATLFLRGNPDFRSGAICV